MASNIWHKPATPTKIPKPKSTPTKIVNDRIKKCVICQKELGILNPETGKKDKSYKVLSSEANCDIENSLSKLVGKTKDTPHPSNHICRNCERKVEQFAALDQMLEEKFRERFQKKEKLKDELVAQYRKHADSLRIKRMVKDSPPRKARKSLLPQVASQSRRPLSRSNTLMTGFAPLSENTDPEPQIEKAIKVRFNIFLSVA